MTEYELLSAREMLAQSNLALADVQASYIAIYLSMVFAYTTVAYVAGRELSKLQSFIATFVYILSSVYVVGTISLMSTGQVAYQRRAEELSKSTADFADELSTILWAEALVLSLLMIASLIFMWNVRNKK